MATNSNTRFPSSAQVPDHSILDLGGKQVYLGNQFNLPISAVSVTTTETNIALIVNPSTSTKSIHLVTRRISSGVSTAQFKFYANPTATQGTAATPRNYRLSSTNSSISVCSTAPTSSASGTLINTLECASGLASIADTSSNQIFILDPGTSMLITATGGGVTVVNANLSWFEI